MTDTSNLAFTKIQDTVYDSKVLEGLVSSGVLPHSLRIIKATVTVTGAAGNYAIIDSRTGSQVILAEGQQVVYLSGVASTTLVGGTSVEIGLATTASGAVATALVPVHTLAVINAGGLAMSAAVIAAPTAAGPSSVLVNNTDLYLVAETLGTFTAGKIQVLLVVV